MIVLSVIVVKFLSSPYFLFYLIFLFLLLFFFLFLFFFVVVLKIVVYPVSNDQITCGNVEFKNYRLNI